MTHSVRIEKSGPGWHWRSRQMATAKAISFRSIPQWQPVVSNASPADCRLAFRQIPTEHTTTSASGRDVSKLLPELEVPFSPDQVRWRVTNTTNDKKRGQIVPYADCRAYTDRLNALFTPQGWTREYKV